MDKKEREDIPNKIDLHKLPVNIKNPDGAPEFIDDHVPGNHGAMENKDGQKGKNEESSNQENFPAPNP